MGNCVPGGVDVDAVHTPHHLTCSWVTASGDSAVEQLEVIPVGGGAEQETGV